MIGRNKLVLCPVAMNIAIQHYLDTMLFREGKAPLVTSVRMFPGGLSPLFEIETEERPTTPMGDPAPS